MHRKIKHAALLAALVSLGLNSPAFAATKKPAAKTAAHKAGKPLATKQTHARAKSSHKALVNQVVLSQFPGRLALGSASALVIDQNSGELLLDKSSNAVTPIASVTKLMTAMVVLDAHLDLNEVISVTEEDVDMLKGTRSRLPVGTSMTRDTALLLALMSSDNRAANALGRHYPGGLRAFVAAMNRKAAELGMQATHFDEPTGLSSTNVSTARDLAKMVAAASQYPDIRRASTTAEAKLEIHGRVQGFSNTNALVKSDNWEIAVSKTGYIAEAGRCLVMQARVADKPVIIVLLDSNGKMTRVGDANRIKRWMESAGLPPTSRRV
jgi:serine-type D-Ala-D-Ala endopeptidase (penicillin-binding protein 7)